MHVAEREPPLTSRASNPPQLIYFGFHFRRVVFVIRHDVAFCTFAAAFFALALLNTKIAPSAAPGTVRED